MHWIASTTKRMRWWIHWMSILRMENKIKLSHIYYYLWHDYYYFFPSHNMNMCVHHKSFIFDKIKILCGKKSAHTHKLCRPMVLDKNSSNKVMLQHLALMVAVVDHTVIYADINLQSSYWLHPVHFPTMMVWPLHTVQPLRLAYGLILMYHFPSSIDSQPN